MDLHGKTVVITGAAGGIGLAMLSRFNGLAGLIIACDIDSARLSAAVQALARTQTAIHPLVADLSTQAGVDTLIAAALDRSGFIDVFCANAGFAYYESLDQADWGRIERLFSLNVFAPIYTATRLREIYAAQPQTAGRPYRVVITASAMAMMAYPGYALYSSSKAALHRFAEAYRFELHDPAAITLIYPIATRTGFFDAAGPRTPRPFPIQSADHVARAIVRGIGRDAHAIYPSRLFAAALLLDRVFPPARRLIQWIAYRQFIRWQRAGSGGPTTSSPAG
jgi:short-subunit dehydrogenase